jgi:hypothetical protein
MDGVSETLQRRLASARYAFHKVVAHRYAVAVLRGEMPEDIAKEHYRVAMANYDNIVKNADTGASEDANAREMGKGAEAITEALAEFAKRREG